MTRITGALAALAFGACLTACATSKPADTRDPAASSEANTVEAEPLVDEPEVEEAWPLGELVETPNLALDAETFYLSPFPSDHTFYLSRGEGTRRYAVLDGANRHVATLVESINYPEAPFPPAEPKAFSAKIEDGGTFSVADSELTRDQPRGEKMERLVFASRYYTYEAQMLEGSDTGWLFDSFSFSAPDELRCESRAECPIHHCDCGNGNTMSTDHYACEMGTCTTTPAESCDELCETADFYEDGVDQE